MFSLLIHCRDECPDCTQRTFIKLSRKIPIADFEKAGNYGGETLEELLMILKNV